MRVLVIPEDDRKDAPLLKPLVEAIMASAGWPRAKVQVCSNPRLGGVGEAFKWDRIEEILDRWKGMTDLFLLIVDRDGVVGRRAALDVIEQRSRGVLPAAKVLLGEHAIEEVEVWILAGQELPADWAFRDIRQHHHPKERYFEPFIRLKGLTDGPPTRARLAREAVRSFQRLRDRCPEDVGRLCAQIEARLAQAGHRANQAAP